jgi:hypothetical protein
LSARRAPVGLAGFSLSRLPDEISSAAVAQVGGSARWVAGFSEKQK